jgi:hypothetical protein
MSTSEVKTVATLRGENGGRKKSWGSPVKGLIRTIPLNGVLLKSPTDWIIIPRLSKIIGSSTKTRGLM